MAISNKCAERIAQLEAKGMKFATDGVCPGIEALSETEFKNLLDICDTMNPPSGQPYLGYGFGFQNRAFED